VILADIRWFEDLPLVLGGIVVIGGFVLISLALARVVARFVRPELLIEHNDLTGFIFAVVGVIYAVVLGFVVIGVWERFEAAEDRTFDEASSLTIVYHDASAFTNGAQLRSDLREYVETVINVGWPALQNAKHSPRAARSAAIVSREVNGTQPVNARQSALYPLMVSAMDEALIDRDARLALDANGLNGMMWFTVYAGGFITISFTFLFGFRRTVMQTAMIGTLALLIGLVIFLTMCLDFPFQGAVRVGPEAFERALSVFDQIDAVDPLTVHTR
jgi:hypothetical protein